MSSNAESIISLRLKSASADECNTDLDNTCTGMSTDELTTHPDVIDYGNGVYQTTTEDDNGTVTSTVWTDEDDDGEIDTCTVTTTNSDGDTTSQECWEQPE